MRETVGFCAVAAFIGTFAITICCMIWWTIEGFIQDVRDDKRVRRFRETDAAKKKGGS